MCQVHSVITNVVKQVGGGWAVYDDSGERRLSRVYDTKAEAVQRLREIEYFKVNSREDPTNTAGARQKTIRWMRKAKAEALREIKRYADSIPRTFTEVSESVITNRRVYLYELNDKDPYLTVREIIERWFGTAGDRPNPRWFFELQVEQVVRRATVTGAERINQLSGAAGLNQPYQVQALLLSQPYQERIRRVSQRVFEEMKGFTTDTANDLARTLSDQMAAGRGVERVKRQIADRFDVSMSRAETIARTELATAHRGARREQTKDARDRLGLDVREQWISQLAPTTRSTHAARHLKFYTPEQNAAFYLVDGNAINCLCNQQTAMIAKDGTVLGARKMSERDKKLVKYLTSTPASER